MENTTAPNTASSATRTDRPDGVACPSWCSEHLDPGPQRPGVCETWHSARLGSVTMRRPTGSAKAYEVVVEIQVLVTEDLLENTVHRGETSATIFLRDPATGRMTEFMQLDGARECHPLAALLMQAGDDLSNVAPKQREPRAVA